jgi:hypothetical protein
MVKSQERRLDARGKAAAKALGQLVVMHETLTRPKVTAVPVAQTAETAPHPQAARLPVLSAQPVRAARLRLARKSLLNQ